MDKEVDFSIVDWINNQLREYGKQIAIEAEKYLFGEYNEWEKKQ